MRPIKRRYATDQKVAMRPIKRRYAIQKVAMRPYQTVLTAIIRTRT
ncbi:MAG TPA: hypothetical protein VI306_11390 [Pyrinomonadaceae bacterium]